MKTTLGSKLQQKNFIDGYFDVRRLMLKINFEVLQADLLLKVKFLDWSSKLAIQLISLKKGTSSYCYEMNFDGIYYNLRYFSLFNRIEFECEKDLYCEVQVLS